MSENQKKWYVLRAVSGKEAKVKEYIDAEIKNSSLGQFVSQVLIPTEKVYSMRNGKKVVKERSYLPGYVLVEAQLNGEVTGHLRDNVPNVLGFLGASVGKQPEPLRESEVRRILGLFDESAESEGELAVPFFVGDNVKVVADPFNGFSGTIKEVFNEKRKLKIEVKIFGRATDVELGFSQVEKE
ncbi:MAG: transcription termination/antitermination protein NusG [Candidatus Aphodosoma sp.]